MNKTALAFKRKIDSLIFATPSFAPLVEEILALQGGDEWMRKGAMRWNRFSDGFPDLMIEDVASLRGRECFVLVDLLDQERIFEQFAFLYALPLYFCASLTVFLPYFPTGTMDRVDQEGQIATAMSLARLFSQIPLTTRGPAKLVIYDIHALQERFYFGNNIIPVLQKAVPLILNELNTNFSDEPITIAFPDDGACKRFGKEFPTYPLLTCSKVRDGDKRKVTVSEGIAKGRHCFIVDDIVKTGGTLVECKNALMEAGASQVSVFVSHGVFPQESWKKFINSGFSHFYMTDSCPTMANQLREQAPFRVLSLASLMLHCFKEYKQL